MRIFINKEMMQNIYLLILGIGIVSLVGQLCLKGKAFFIYYFF